MVSVQTVTTNSLRCTVNACRCDEYSPAEVHPRRCRSCRHGWIAHVLSSEQRWSSLNNNNYNNNNDNNNNSNGDDDDRTTTTVARRPASNTVREMASLILYGVKAIPIRLKILLDRLLAVFDEQTDIDDLLGSFGWSWEDYTRGYMLNVQRDTEENKLLNRWLLCNREEEEIMQSFLNIAETRNLASIMMMSSSSNPSDFVVASTSSNGNNNYSTPSTSSLFPSPPTIMGGFNCCELKNFEKFAMRQKEAVEKMIQNQNCLFANSRCTPIYAMNNNYRCPPSIRIPLLPPGVPVCDSNNFQEHHGSEESLVSPNSTHTESPESLCSSSRTTSRNVSLSLESLGKRSLTTPTLSTSEVQPAFVNRSRSANAILTGAIDDSGLESDQEQAEDLSMKKCSQLMSNKQQKLNQPSTTSGQFYNNPVSLYYSKTLRNVRKTAIKRLHPSSLAQLGTNPLTGKKRVQCRVCLKTFCDKGALKIHISAVHLREMHQCTVEGCNMVFSSRRSRNRHSANQNPKLHTPTYRRNSLPGSGCRVISPPSAAEEYRRMIAELDEPSRVSKKSHTKHHHLSNWDPSDDHCDTVSKSDTGSDITTPTDEMPRGVRKRKSDHPTKLKQPPPPPPPCFDLNTVEDHHKSFKEIKKRNVVVEEIIQNPSPVFDNNDNDAKSNEGAKAGNQILDVLDCRMFQSSEDSTTAISRLANMTQSLCRPQQLLQSATPVEPANVAVSPEQHSPRVIPSICSPVAIGVSGGCKSSSSSVDIPIDEDNPRKCSACGKIFQNHFSVKTHYQNVHLKLMHKCTVDGCNAKFPSKRSRDRHSQNQNLHRKLLSTSRDPSPSPTNVTFGNGGVGGGGKVTAFRPEFIPGQLYPFGVGAPPMLPFAHGLLNPFWARMAAAPLGLPGANPFFPPTSDAVLNHHAEIINGTLNLSKKASGVVDNSTNSPVSSKAEAVK